MRKGRIERYEHDNHHEDHNLLCEFLVNNSFTDTKDKVFRCSLSCYVVNRHMVQSFR